MRSRGDRVTCDCYFKGNALHFSGKTNGVSLNNTFTSPHNQLILYHNASHLLVHGDGLWPSGRIDQHHQQDKAGTKNWQCWKRDRRILSYIFLHLIHSEVWKGIITNAEGLFPVFGKFLFSLLLFFCIFLWLAFQLPHFSLLWKYIIFGRWFGRKFFHSLYPGASRTSVIFSSPVLEQNSCRDYNAIRQPRSTPRMFILTASQLFG